MNTEFKYPIKAVSEITGLSTHVIRAWEKRYHTVEPNRSDSNRRLYSAKELEKLTLLKKATDRGHSISSISSLSIDELLELLGNERKSDESQNDKKDNTGSSSENYEIQEFLNGMLNYDETKLDEILLHASVKYNKTKLLENIITPVMIKIGELWHNGDIRISHEHFATSIIRKFLLNLLETQRSNSNAANIIICTPKGQTHELGALVAANYAANEGLKVTYLGADLPAEDIVSAAIEVSARIICLSIIFPADDVFLNKEIERLGQICPPHISIIAGGTSVIGYKNSLNKIGAKIIENNSNLTKQFTSLR